MTKNTKEVEQTHDEMLNDVLSYTKNKERLKDEKLKKLKKQQDDFHQSIKQADKEREVKAQREIEREERKRIAQAYIEKQKKRQEMLQIKEKLKGKHFCFRHSHICRHA